MEEKNIVIEEPRKGVSAWVSIVVYSIAFALLSVILSSVVYLFFIPIGATSMELLTVSQLCLVQATTLVSGLIPAILMLKYLDLRPFSDLGFSLQGRGKDILYGLLAAVVLFGVGFGLSVAGGLVRVTGVLFNPGWLLGTLFLFMLVAVAEELMFRGYILGRLLRTRMNKFLALSLSSLLFASLHLMNPNIAFMPVLNLLLAGVLLGSTYIYTRNLWFPISFHLFWNWLQGPVLGYEVSGNKFGESLLKLHLSDNTLLNGGAFGFEGSLFCTVLLVMLTAGIIWWFERKPKASETKILF